jgi:hypothetical protein
VAASEATLRGITIATVPGTSIVKITVFRMLLVKGSGPDLRFSYPDAGLGEGCQILYTTFTASR